MAEGPDVYGILAGFDSADRLVAATREARAAGYTRLDAYTPFPVEGLAEALDFTQDRVPLLVLLGAAAGIAIGYFLQYYSAVIDYPFNSGGKPLHSWPAFLLVTFELGVLGGALAGFLGMLALNGLPQPYHPLFNAQSFQLATRDRFFLCIEARDPQFDRDRTRAWLEQSGAVEVVEVVGDWG